MPVLTFVIGGVDLSWSFPVLKQLALTSFTYEGGMGIPPELIALTLALTLYTATFIAENVRAGIEGIGKGQKEAAASIGLTPNQVLKLVEKYLNEEFEPKLKKLSRKQGQILVKLINRQTGQTTFDLIKDYKVF